MPQHTFDMVVPPDLAAVLGEGLAGLGPALMARGWRMATAESCTGGLVGALCTSVSGSSDWFAGGVIAYANEVKEQVLGVPGATLAAHGAVSEPVVLGMARGACRVVGTQAAVSLSGVAGPTGGTPDKPVGMVWIGYAVNGVATAEVHHFTGTRHEVRMASAAAALAGLTARVREA